MLKRYDYPNYPALWQTKAAARNSLRTKLRPQKTGAAAAARQEARATWAEIVKALADSASEKDRRLAAEIAIMLSNQERAAPRTIIRRPEREPPIGGASNQGSVSRQDGRSR